MSNVTRNHKDNVFCLLYRDKKNLLSLYNAVNGTSYEKEEELEVVTLKEAICLRIRNDAAFVIDSSLNLYEQQSSVNPNMPLRDLYYVAEELKKIAPPGSLYGTAKAKIPVPRFVVFYNGTMRQPERRVYRLSELFAREVETPELELVVTMINITPGCNKELHDKTLFEDGMAVGEEKGEKMGNLRRLISQICKKMKKSKTLEEIAEDLEEELSAIEPLYHVAEKFAPDYNPESVFEETMRLCISDAENGIK